MNPKNHQKVIKIEGGVPDPLRDLILEVLGAKMTSKMEDLGVKIDEIFKSFRLLIGV